MMRDQIERPVYVLGKMMEPFSGFKVRALRGVDGAISPHL